MHRWVPGMLILFMLAAGSANNVSARRLLDGVFENLEYPDNGNRQTRGHELAQQCADLTVELTNSKQEIDALLVKASTAVYAVYKGLTPDIPAYDSWTAKVQLTDAPLGDIAPWAAFAAEAVSPFVVAPEVYKVLSGMFNDVYSASLLASGDIGPAAFVRLAGLPEGWVLEGVLSKAVSGAGAVVVTAGIEAAIDAVTGSIKRDKLREVIHAAYPARLKLKLSVMKAEQIKIALSSIEDSYTAVLASFTNDDGTPNYTQKQADNVSANLLKKHKSDLDGITEAVAKDKLHQQDVNTSAWTNEDE